MGGSVCVDGGPSVATLRSPEPELEAAWKLLLQLRHVDCYTSMPMSPMPAAPRAGCLSLRARDFGEVGGKLATDLADSAGREPELLPACGGPVPAIATSPRVTSGGGAWVCGERGMGPRGIGGEACMASKRGTTPSEYNSACCWDPNIMSSSSSTLVLIYGEAFGTSLWGSADNLTGVQHYYYCYEYYYYGDCYKCCCC